MDSSREVKKPKSNRSSHAAAWLERHITYATLIRLALTVYSEWHDKMFTLKYTDIDYHIFNDAANYVTRGESPYLRPTYRYSPILAIILTANIYIHPIIGKLLFVAADIAVGYLVYLILNYYGTPDKFTRVSLYSWLYNPLIVIISTRGSSDSLVTLLVLLTLYLLLKDRLVYAGLVYGLAVHFKLYPLIYCLPLYFSQVGGGRTFSVVDKFLYPSRHRIKFASWSIISFSVLTMCCYAMYGDLFVKEAHLYHLFRRDIKHNFSVYFYMLYLLSDVESPFVSFVTFLPQVILLVIISIKFYDKANLPFCLFLETYAFVTFNKVCTSQYFVWYLSLLPLVLPRLKMKKQNVFFCLGIWLATQGLWLLAAYLLEFQGYNTFFYIWLASIAFFLANCTVMSEMIKSYS